MAKEPDKAHPAADRHQGPGGSVPKLCGGDVELGNFILGVERSYGTGAEASRALLREIHGAQRVVRYQTACNCASCRARREREAADDDGDASDTDVGSYNAQDWGRKFLPCNGGCVYIDLDHLEVCLPEVVSAYDHVAAWHAMLIIAREAMNRANAKLPTGRKIQVLVNNSDGHGNSYGSHMDFLISRSCFNNIFHRKLHHLLYLATYLTSSIAFTGAGKVGSENGRPEATFQLAQRADFYETLTGIQTTTHRPIVNSRDEALCGPSRLFSRDDQDPNEMARLHVIFFDNTLCHVASLLKVGVTQIVLAMIEQDHIAPHLILDDPLDALLTWSRDPDFHARAPLLSGRRYTALDMQHALLEEAGLFVAAGHADGVVPRAQDIISCWAETLSLLSRGDISALASRLDWALKRCALERAMHQRHLDWSSPEIRHLDQLYGSLDPSEGLYWAYVKAGVVERVVSDGEIERFVHEPPNDTRAWLRAHLLRRADQQTVDNVDWDAVELRLRKKGRRFWPSYEYRKVEMSNPLGSTREACESVFAGAPSMEDILGSLQACDTDADDDACEKGDEVRLLQAPADVADQAWPPGEDFPGTTDTTPYDLEGGCDDARA